VIVATSGHIDHGKTVLVKALTGVDTDRLPEEKSRGISIDLGYAYQPIEGGGALGFVDVPGHERFVRNMLAGVTGIDFALLVVAADDGPMPQTEEHLAILDLLGIRRGAVALTKIDRAEPERVAEAAELIEVLVHGTCLEGAPVFAVSGITGQGVDALRDHLHRAARDVDAAAARGNFRLAVDRRFTVPGAGLVVTGTVFSGTVAVDDRLTVSPAGLPARVRGIHAQNRAATTGTIGQRCALNIAGPDIGRDRVQRGDWVVAEGAHAPTSRFDARIRLLPGEPRPLRHWTPVHLHIGAADIGARVAVLGGRQIAPGDSALVQLVLDHPTGAVADDRFILRDQSARRTMAGGRVIDPFAPARGRARPERLEVLAALENPDPAAALASLLTVSPDGVELARFASARNLTEAEAKAVWAAVPMIRVGRSGAETGLPAARWTALAEETLAALRRWHAETPDQPGLAESALRRRLARPLSAAVFSELVATLVADGRMLAANMRLSLPDHRTAVAPADAQMWSRIAPVLDRAGLRPPTVAELADETGQPAVQLARLLRRFAAMRLVVAVADNRYFTPGAVRALADIAERIAPNGGLTASAFRDESGIGRNLAIEVLEFFDKAGLTRRVGNAREIRRPAASLFGERTVDH